MHYRDYAPAPDLADAVRSYWTLEGYAIDGTVERVLPDGRTEWVVHLGDGFAGQARALAIGQAEAWTELQPQGRVAVFGVNFHPHGMAAFGAVPQHQLTGRIFALNDLWGAAARRWQEQVQNAWRTSDRIAMTECWLRTIRRPIPVREAAAVQMLRRRHGLNIDDLAAKLNCSRRHLERRFLDAVGLPPKQIASLFRFQRALALERSQPVWNWSRIAAECGYADQAHLTAEFRRYSGRPPRERSRSETAMERLLVRPEAA